MQISRFLSLGIALFLVLLAIPVSSLLAQSATTGALSGTVSDAGGMALPGALITLVNQDNNQTQTANADENGAYRFSLLAPGAYEVRFAIQGYKLAHLASVTVSVSEAPNVAARLDPGEGETVVACLCEVTAASSSSTGTLVDAKTITSVPLNTRNLTQVLSISSGSAADVNNAGNLGRNNQTVNVNGNTTAGTLTVDGAMAPSSVPNPDTISELRIDTSQYDAGFGAQVPTTNLIIRSGTNQIHGVLWEFLRNDVFNANTFFRNSTGQSKPNLKQNQFGGTLGGPIKKDRIFFFGSYQGTQQVNGLDPTSASTVILPPLTNDRSAAGIAAAFCPANHPADARYQSFAGGRQIDCANRTTATTAPVNPIALSILQAKLADGSYLIPGPQTILNTGANAGLGFSSYSFPSTFKEHQILLSGDYVVNAKNTLYARFFTASIDQFRTFGGPGGFPGAAIVPGSGAPQLLDGRDHVGALKLNSVISARLANELRIGLTRQSTLTSSEGAVKAASFGMTPVNPSIGEPPEMTVLGPLGTFRFFGNAANDFTIDNNSTILTDNLSWSRGRQTIRTGGTFLLQDNDRNDTSNSRGRITFQTFSDFLLGLNANENLSPSGRSNTQTIQANLGSGPKGEVQYLYRRYYGAAYVQDDIKLTSTFSVNMGLRWEYIGASSDRAGTMGGVDPVLLRSAAIPSAAGTLVGNVVAANYDPNLVNPYTGKAFGPVPAGVGILSTNSLYANSTPRDSFAPRVGFAWQPSGRLFKSHRASVRGGYGWFYQAPTFSGNAAGAPLFTAPPFAQSFTNTDTSNSTSTLQQPFPTVTLGFVPRTPTSRLSDRIAGPEYRLPLLQQWNLSTQYSLTKTLTLDVGYVGSEGSRLLIGRGINQPLLASAANPVNCGYTGFAAECITTNTSLNARQRVPIMGENPNALTASEYTGASSYHSMQATLRKSLSKGLNFSVSYTFSKSMNNTNVLGDQNNPALNWARAAFDRRHRITTNFSYLVPSPFTKGLQGLALSGWSLTGLIIMQSGSPITLTDPFAGGVYGRAANSTITVCPGSTHGDLETSGSIQQRLNGWINSSAICSPPVIGSDRNATGYGTAGQSLMVGPDQFNTDFSLGKTGRVGGLREDAQLAFRVELYNALNHPQFSNPGTTLGTATFGVITQTSVAPRIIQFALKYMF